MNTLLFDAGNSRLKWALVRGDRMGAMQAAAIADTGTLQRWLSRQKSIDGVVGACVAGAAYERRLKSLLLATGHPEPAFVRSTESAAGVQNGYEKPPLLGHDRWAAAVGAWHQAGCSRSVCAVSVGTALTIDVVDQAGRHLGGLIAPGPALMVDALLDGTKGIAARAKLGSSRVQQRSRKTWGTSSRLARNTHDAIERGSLGAAAGVIDRTVSQLTRELGTRPAVFISGGGADAVLPLLKFPCKPCVDLVLRGVALIAGVPIRRRP